MPDEQIPEETESQVNAGVAKAGGIMVFSLLMSRVLGIVRDMILTNEFGMGAESDAYRLAFMLPDILFFLISGGALSSAFIPVFSEYWHTNRPKEAWKVFSGVMCTISVFLLGFVLLCALFAEPLYREILAPGKSAEVIAQIVPMSRILLPAQFAFFLGGLMLGTLYVRKVFAIPGLAPNIYNLGIIFGALVISRFVSVPFQGVCWGAAGGAVIGNLIIPFIQMRKLGMHFELNFYRGHEGVKKVFRLMLPVILGLSLPAVFGLIMQHFGSHFSDGINSVLDLSNRLMQAPLGIFGQSLAIAVFPVLTQFFTQNRMDLFRNQLDRTMRTVIYLTVPISVLLAVLAPQISSGLYLGKSTTHEQTLQIATCLRIFCIGIWAWCLHPILMRAFYSLQDTKTPVIIGTATTGIFLTMLIIGKETPLGYLALPLAGSIAPIIMVFALSKIAAKKVGGMDFAGLFTTFGKSMLGSVVVAIICGIVSMTSLATMMLGHRIETLLITAFVFCVAMWAYYFVTKAMKMPECEYLDRVMNRFNRKAKSG